MGIGVLRRRLIGALVVAVALGVPVASAGEEFVPGSGRATARSFRLAPHAAGLEIAVGFGKAAAHFEGSQAQAETEQIDLGIVELILTTGSCGGDPYLRRDQMPQPLQVNSRKGDAVATRPGPGGLGAETVTARPNAYARADNVAGALDALPQAFVMRGPRTLSEVELEPGRSRRAEATALLGELSIAGGLVRLTGMEWYSEHRTGEGKGTAGHFRMGGMTLGGQEMPSETPEQMRTSLEQINGVLGPLGLRIELPVVRRTDDGMWMEVTPLTLVVGEGTTLGPVIAPLLPLAQPVRDAIIEDLASCGGPLGSFSRLIAGGVTVADVSLGAFSGTGGIDFEFGGTRSSTEGVAYDSPFEDIPDVLPEVAPPVVAASDEPNATRTVRSVGVEGRTASTGRAASRSTRCESSHPNVRAGCSDGRGVLAGGIAVLFTALLVGGEVWRMRRRNQDVA